MPGIQSWKVSHKSNTEFQFKTLYFLGVKEMTASSYMVYGYTSGHTDLYSIYVLCIQYTYISIQYIYF